MQIAFGVFQAHGRQDSLQALGEHALVRPQGAYEQHIVAAGEGYLQGPLGPEAESGTISGGYLQDPFQAIQSMVTSLAW